MTNKHEYGAMRVVLWDDAWVGQWVGFYVGVKGQLINSNLV